MSIKKKLILIGVCAVIVIAVIALNVIHLMKQNSETGTEQAGVKENVISRAEAYRLLSFLNYDKADREAIPTGITYTDEKMSGWYDTYVNAVWKMGLIDSEVKISPDSALTYGDCKSLIDKLITGNPQLQGIYSGLSFDFVKSDQQMLIPEFLEIYEAIVKAMPSDKSIVKEETLFVLDREISTDGRDRIVTDLGRYYYKNSKDYEKFLKPAGGETSAAAEEQGTAADKASDNAAEADISEEDIAKENNAAKEDNKADQTASSDEASEAETSGTAASDTGLTGEDYVNLYVNKGIKALVCGQEIIYIKGTTTDKIVIHNVWIKQGKDLLVDTFINGIDKAFNAQFKLSTEIEKVIGDITIENQRVIGISVKPDVIHGKVLMSGDDFIEVEGYGKLPLEKDYKIYKIYGELSMEETTSILVGYENTDFVVSDGKISAALITESIKAENIRVLLHTTDFGDIYHSSVELTSDTDFTVKSGDKSTKHNSGEIVTIKPGDDMLSDGRIKVTPDSENGRIQILSIKRSEGNPKYRGSIEVSEGDKGLLVINELPLEEYLYAVIPSEMPTYYGVEALKVQAICARSYAYRHLMANSLSEYGAHVDDSVAYQVYNNIPENEDSILAVKDTYGKVIEYDGDVITAYYFSTSCGHTTGVESVWANGEPTPYLTGRLMAVEGDSEGVVSQSEKESIYDDLSKEENFRSFITDKDFETYDSSYNWYRWKVTIDAEDIRKTIDKKLAGRYEANPELIQTLVSGSVKDGDAVFESRPVDTVGDIKSITALKRGSGGIIFELLIEGTENTIKVQTEYNIRILISPINDTVYRMDETGVDNLSLLPSAFFIIDPVKEDGKLKSFSLVGGGYGHGVGMSQNGVKAMTDEGRKYEDIIQYFYEGTKLGFIYE